MDELGVVFGQQSTHSFELKNYTVFDYAVGVKPADDDAAVENIDRPFLLDLQPVVM